MTRESVVANRLRLRIGCASVVSVSDTTERILTGSDPAGVARAAREVAAAAVQEIEANLPRAVKGERRQLRAYVLTYRELVSRVLEAIGKERPDLIDIGGEGARVFFVQANTASKDDRQRVPWLKEVLNREAMSVPFTDWVGTLGAGRGTAVAMVAVLREMLPDAQPLPPPDERRLPEWDLKADGVVRFYRAVLDELESSEAPLDRIRTVFGLSRTELAGLFGVRRQALDRWAARGVPAERQEKLATIGEIADLLAANLKEDRIPGVVRRPSPAYGERSALAAIAEDEQNLVLGELRDAFDWASAA